MIRSKDFLSGLLFLAIGAAGLILGTGLRFGSSQELGPGFLPKVTLVLLAVLGLVLIARAVLSKARDVASGIAWRPLLLIASGVAMFGLIVERVGLLIALPLLALVVGLAAQDFRWKEVIVCAVLLSAFMIGLFKYGLNLALPL